MRSFTGLEETRPTPVRAWLIFWATTAVTAGITAVATKGAEWAIEALRERCKARKGPPR
jgi:hypothetical protein